MSVDYVERLLALADKEQDVCGEASYYKDIPIKVADKMMDAINKKKPLVKYKTMGISYVVPPDNLTIRERRAINYLIVGFLHSGDPEKIKWAKNTFFERNQGFIGHMIEKHYPTYVRDRYDDLFQAGCIGLLKALNNLDPSISETASSTSYPTQYVLHEIYVEINGKTSLVSLRKKVNDATRALENLGIYEPTAVALSASTDLPTTQVELGRNYSDYGKTVELTEEISAGDSFNPAEEFLIKERQQILEKAFDDLPEQDAECLKLLYGLGDRGGKQLTDAQVAEKLGITTNEVKIIVAKSFETIRKNKELSELFSPDRKPSGDSTDKNGDDDITKLVN